MAANNLKAHSDTLTAQERALLRVFQAMTPDSRAQFQRSANSYINQNQGVK